MSTKSLGRRTFLRGAAGATAAAAGAGIISACSSGATPKNNTDGNKGVQLPEYIRYEGVKPDLPGDESGVADGFLAYPADPVDAITDKPGTGGKISSLALIYNALSTPLERNTYWQEVNKQLGAEMTFNISTPKDYTAKLSTALAGNELPDIVLMPSGTGQRRIADVLKAKFTDLSEHLAGDAVKDYPFLANLSTLAWKQTAFAGGIYGVPISRMPVGGAMMVRQDITQQLDLDHAVKSGEEFLELCRAVTDPKKHRWAMGLPMNALGFVLQMLDAPNVWAESGGKFTHEFESDAMKKALEFMNKLWKEGLLHPDSFGSNNQDTLWFGTGVVAMRYTGAGAWDYAMTTSKEGNPQIDVAGIISPKFDGGGDAPHRLGNGSFGFGAITRTKPEKVKEILRILNFLSAPFGTAEYLLRKFGVKDVDYTLKGSDPVPSPKGLDEVRVPFSYITESPWVLYLAGQPDVVKRQYEYQKAVVPKGRQNAAIGLYSETELDNGPTINKVVTTAQQDIIQGHKPLSAWDEVVAAWRKNGGDQIRTDLEKSFAESQ